MFVVFWGGRCFAGCSWLFVGCLLFFVYVCVSVLWVWVVEEEFGWWLLAGGLVNCRDFQSLEVDDVVSC